GAGEAQCGEAGEYAGARCWCAARAEGRRGVGAAGDHAGDGRGAGGGRLGHAGARCWCAARAERRRGVGAAGDHAGDGRGVGGGGLGRRGGTRCWRRPATTQGRGEMGIWIRIPIGQRRETRERNI
ncbi:hypothetical protein BRADI_3g26498v3, partial [Brachypodium distachyon]